MLFRSALLAAALGVVALACGDVPTLEGGIAFISPVILPSPAVAFGDTLRNEAGEVAPLRVFAIDNAGDTLQNVEPPARAKKRRHSATPPLTY